MNGESVALEDRSPPASATVVRRRRISKRKVRKPSSRLSDDRSDSSGTKIKRKISVRKTATSGDGEVAPSFDAVDAVDQMRQILSDATESSLSIRSQEDVCKVVGQLRRRLSELETQVLRSAENSVCDHSDGDVSTTARRRKSLQEHLKLNLQGMSRSTNSSPAHSACSSPLNGSPNRTAEQTRLTGSQSSRDATSAACSDFSNILPTGLDRATSLDDARRNLPPALRDSAKRKLFSSPKRFNISLLTPRSPKKSPKSATMCSTIDLTRHKVHLHRPIGHGGTSMIYEATVDGWMVAAKLYHQYFPADNPKDKQRDRIQLILNALCALPRHQNILPMLGYAFIKENRLVVLCERVECTLRDLIDARRIHYHETMLKHSSSSESLQLISFESTESLSSALSQNSNDKEGTPLLSRHSQQSLHAPPLPSLPVPPFTVQEVLGLWKQIVQGVAFLHRLPEPCNIPGGGRILAVWHRDLKSENVMCSPRGADVDEILSEQEAADSGSSLNTSGRFRLFNDSNVNGSLHERYVLKLGDFDEMHVVYDIDDRKSPIKWQEGSPADAQNTLAEASSGRVMRRSRTLSLSGRQPASSVYERLSLNVGTLEFMAPEMADSKTALYDERVDVWSLGMILYELLTLELPYGRDAYTQFELPDVVNRGIRPTLPQGYLSKSENGAKKDAQGEQQNNDDNCEKTNNAPPLPHSQCVEDEDDDDGEDEEPFSQWKLIVQLFYECTHRSAEKRPSACDILRKIDEILTTME